MPANFRGVRPNAAATAEQLAALAKHTEAPPATIAIAQFHLSKEAERPRGPAAHHGGQGRGLREAQRSHGCRPQDRARCGRGCSRRGSGDSAGTSRDG